MEIFAFIKAVTSSEDITPGTSACLKPCGTSYKSYSNLSPICFHGDSREIFGASLKHAHFL